MKKFFLLLLISMLFMACTKNTVISTDDFVNDLNSFDSTATYIAVDNDSGTFQFIINQNDSLFTYDVERTSTTRAIFMTSFVGHKVK